MNTWLAQAQALAERAARRLVGAGAELQAEVLDLMEVGVSVVENAKDPGVSISGTVPLVPGSGEAQGHPRW